MMNLPPQLNESAPSLNGMPSMMGNNAPMEENDESTSILAHFSPEELLELDEAQGGATIDPETNLRDYRQLEKIMEIPEIQQLISNSLSQMKQQNFAEGGYVDEPGRPNDPELEKLRLEGRKGDTELAIITPKLLEMFTEIAGKSPDINPVTGFPEFFRLGNVFKSIIRVVGTALGPITGFLGSKLTGQSTGAALKNAGIGFALPLAALAAPSIMGALGGGAGGAGGAGGFLGNLFSSAPGTGGSGGLISNLGSVGRMLPGMGSQVASQGVGQAAGQALPQAAGQMGGGILGALTKGLPLLGSGLMLAKGHRDDKRNAADYENKQRQETDAMRNKLGFNSPLKPAKPFEYGEANFDIPRGDYKRGKIPRFFNYDLAEQHAAEGGPIRGTGKGQQDNIPTNLEDGSYIIDASTVSDIGDGSTDAGFKELDQYFSQIPSQNIPSKAGGGYLKAMVSDGEYEISPEKVTALGGGSNDRGAKILEGFVKKVRAKKRTSGKKLPPKSKPIGGYLKKLHAA
jgi:hypothetical protein